MASRRWWILIVLAAGFGLGLFAGCSESGGQACTLDSDCRADEYCGGDGKCHPRSQDDGGQDGADLPGDAPGDGDSGPGHCERDLDCPPGEVCDSASSTCVAGIHCNQDANCNITEEFCDPDGKVCKDRAALCERCSRHLECPDPSLGDMCITYPDGMFCGKACGAAGCPVGFECDPNSGSGTGVNPGQCRSNTGLCGGQFICHDDGDCSSQKYCDRATGNCLPKCISDMNCPSGKKCHYTGQCGDPCSSDADCDAFGPDLICCTAPGIGYCDSNSTGRCRPEGCVLHSECLVTTGDSLGYCDKRTHECKLGCRWADARNLNDCSAGMKCDCIRGTVSCDTFDCCPDPNQGPCLCDPELQDCSQVDVCDDGVCIEIPCNERGDVSVACSRNQVCCGWPSDGYSCPGGVPSGDCYVAPMATWCSACSEEGKSCEVAGTGFGEPGICITDGGDSNTYCHLACRTAQDCPSTWSCDYSFMQACETADDCEAGATCELGYRGFDDQGEVQEVNVCICSDDSQCPADFNDTGFAGTCLSQQLCDYTVSPIVCVPGNVCKFAKACQCSTCCSELASGS